MSKSLLSAVIAAFLLLGLPILAGDRLPAALAQVAVSFMEWTVPTKGSHPHDPLAAADGSIWYTGADGEHARAARSQNWSVQGISHEHS